MDDDQSKATGTPSSFIFSQESSRMTFMQDSQTRNLFEIKNESEIPDYVSNLKERMLKMNESIECVRSHIQSIVIDTVHPCKEKMLMLTELFNEIHAMCGEIQQIISHIHTLSKIEMSLENKQLITTAEEEINKVLNMLSILKTDLHEKISKCIEAIETKELIENLKSDNHSTKSFDTDLSFVTDTLSSRVSSSCHQIKFIQDYILTLTKNIEEIYNTLNCVNVEVNDYGKLHDQTNELKILERHLNRNSPLIKEIEYWLAHDFSKPPIDQDDTVQAMKKDYDHLCDILTRTNSLMAYKNELLHKELDAARINEIPRPASRISKKSSSFSRPRREILSDDDLREYQSRKQAETQELYNDIDEASSKLLKLTSILENINQAINDNRFVPITNDSMVAQQCYIYKIQLDLLKIHQKDLDWLLNFTSPCKLCAIEIPDSLLIQITDLKSSWSSTKNRVLQSQDALSKIRELWILFEYYTVRIILWNKAVKTKQSTWDVEIIKNEAEIIKKKIIRVKKIKKQISRFISGFSNRIIDKLWQDTLDEFNDLCQNL